MIFVRAGRWLARWFARYPGEVAAHPRSFDSLKAKATLSPQGSDVLAIQVVLDRFYFLLFGALALRLPSRRVDAVVVRAISGAIGCGWRNEFFRSAPIAGLLSSRWLRAFGSVIQRVAYRSATWRHPVSDLINWHQSAGHWRRLNACESKADYAINGIQVGDLIIDAYLRFRPAPAFNSADPFVRKLLWQALRDLRMATAYFKRTKPRWYLTSYSTYIEHGIPVRVALREGVDVWSFGNLNSVGKRLTLDDTYHTRNTSEYRRVFDMLDKQDARLDEARTQLEVRLSGGIDAATSYMKKSAYSAESTPLPAGLRGAAIVFLHDFYDSPHIYADFVFDDFWQWICFTIEALQQEEIGFFLKPHPNQIALSDEALDLLKHKYPNLRWLDTNISNVELANAGIVCGITVYGTVAHELAYLGVPSIGCARHPHHAFDFCRTARDQDQYRQLLLTPTVRPGGREEMRRQALAFYYMHNLYGAAKERQLQRAFVSFWRICDTAQAGENDILSGFNKFVMAHGFDQLIEDMRK